MTTPTRAVAGPSDHVQRRRRALLVALFASVIVGPILFVIVSNSGTAGVPANSALVLVVPATVSLTTLAGIATHLWLTPGRRAWAIVAVIGTAVLAWWVVFGLAPAVGEIFEPLDGCHDEACL